MAKNFLVAIARRPLSFLLLTYGIPIALLAVLLSIPSFVSSSDTFGVGSPKPIRDFASTVEKKLVIVKPPHLGPDVDRVIDVLTRPLKKDLVQFLDDEATLAKLCLANRRGVSNCHAAVVFRDSPGTTAAVRDSLRSGNGSHSWQYTIQVDPSHRDRTFDATNHRSDQEDIYMPLQLAVNNAIINETVVPEVFMYTSEPQENQHKRRRQGNALLVGQTYAFGLFACYYFIIYRFASFITVDRSTGMSQLVDAMGGGSATAARVVSWLLLFDAACLPCFIVFGVLHWYILFPSSSPWLLISWQVLLGLAVNSTTVFASAFFTKSRVSAVYVVGGFLLLSVCAQVFTFQDDPKPSPPGANLLALLFPSSNHVFFTQQMCLWELNGLGARISEIPAEVANITSESYGLTQATMLGFLVLNIIVHPLLAVFVEKMMHGIDFRRRTFSNEVCNTSGVVAETFDLKKRFVPNILERIFCCGQRKPITAVNGVSLQGYRGQILCLVGLNGSGKTTTLHMISGFISPTEGEITLNALPSQIGICPQRNTLWEELTVDEHVSIWSRIKAGDESAEQLDQLMAACDLATKTTSMAKTLSGGQKRKLQLACMFVGDSSVCLVDECTSGLDPLSRRAIWEILLAQRTKRSIVFTTHFLDEVDVLADHMVVLSKGKVKCQGPVAELKNLYGGGYKVLVPRSAAAALQVQYPSTSHQDSLVYAVPDSRSAAQLCSQFAGMGVTDVAIAGPQIEDVFLNVTDEHEMSLAKDCDGAVQTEFQMEPSRVLPFWGQVRVLLRKRFTVLRRFWWPYFYVLALPLVITPFFKKLLYQYQSPSCAPLEPLVYSSSAYPLHYTGACNEYEVSTSGCNKNQIILGPESAKADARDIVGQKFYYLSELNESTVDDVFIMQNGRQQFLDYVGKHTQVWPGGVHMGSGDEPPVIAYAIGTRGLPTGSEMLHLYTQMKSKVEIISSNGIFADIPQGALNNGAVYAIFFTLLQAIYPAAFILYPAIEKAQKVRSLEYANGVRRGPLWVAYGLFDFIFVFFLSIGVTAIVASEWNGPVWILLPILALYGLAATLLGYVLSHFVNGPLKSFIVAAGTGMLTYAIAAVAFAVGSANADAAQMDPVALGVTYGLNIILPVGNMFRTMLLGLNVGQVGCKDGAPTPPSSIYAYGGPILYLVIQVAALLLLIIWIEGDIALFRRGGGDATEEASRQHEDSEKHAAATRSDPVESETIRVENAETDLLRVLHVSKSFKHNTAVDNVTFGLSKSDVTALLGPNGAGKSTLVNLIQSELSPDSGRVLLMGEDARTRSAQKHLGVCPQYDALDLMNTREHLSFYARVKGIKDVRGNVDHIMARLNLTPHASTLASKLSGGNKRKLSLAIALMGTPPVLILDEPTSAMDAVAKRSFWRLIQQIAPGRSLLLTTHSMEEADTLATRAAIISRRMLAVGTTKSLRQQYANYYYVSLLLASAPYSSTEEMEGIREWVQEHVGGAQLERDLLGGQVRFTIPGIGGQSGRIPVAAVIDLLERNKEALGLAYYSVGGATLENVFLNVVQENNRIPLGMLLHLLGRSNATGYLDSAAVAPASPVVGMLLLVVVADVLLVTLFCSASVRAHSVRCRYQGAEEEVLHHGQFAEHLGNKHPSHAAVDLAPRLCRRDVVEHGAVPPQSLDRLGAVDEVDLPQIQIVVAELFDAREDPEYQGFEVRLVQTAQLV
ncbi:putative PWI domain mRNA processing protein [Purpureocillium lavendulum]|uniref:PWI domain mRNA processing protein n=1 Tax=Purpureocillium lavendulum TaxID=1247861 RepID=A0AB34G3U7_9HYPO|nr:putative PWI domain mRNA processing protein [Purpureocillium lavendulum]